MKQWYTLHTKPNSEYQVADTLQQRGLTTYLPQVTLNLRRTSRTKRPFFPCYLFVYVDFKQVGLSAVRWTPGLRRVVAFDDQPIPVDPAIVDLIRVKLGDIEARGGSPAHSFKPGDTVRITTGPFRDMLAIFDSPVTAAERVQVLLNILGHASRVQVDVDDLASAKPGQTAPEPQRKRRTRGKGRRIKYN